MDLRIFTFIFILIVQLAFPKEKSNKTPIRILNTDILTRDDSRPNVDQLSGNVKIKHEDVIITSDKAFLYDKNCFVQAEGHVKVNQADSIFLDGEYLEYNCDTKVAIVKYNVVLTTATSQLKTDTLKLFRLKDLAIFSGGGSLKDSQGLHIDCLDGTYYMEDELYDFKHNVVMRQDTTFLYTDFATYNPSDSTLTSHSRTKIIQSKKDTLIFDRGVYNYTTSKGHGYGNVEGFYSSSYLETDNIQFDKSSGTILLFKNSTIIDSSKQNTLQGNFIEILKKHDSIFATQDPYYIYKGDSTTTEFTADTLISKKIDSSEIVYGYGHSRFFNIDFASLSRSTTLNKLSKELFLLGDPIVWTKEGAQLTADTILVTFKETTDSISGATKKELEPDSLFALHNAFFIEHKPEYDGYNQIKGRFITGAFKNGKMDMLLVYDSCEVIYFYENEGDLSINFSKTDTINMIFKDGLMHRSIQKGDNNGHITPFDDVKPKDTKLVGFQSFFSLRAFSKAEVKQANEVLSHSKKASKLPPDSSNNTILKNNNEDP